MFSKAGKFAQKFCLIDQARRPTEQFYICHYPELIKMITPPLRHLYTLVPIVAAIIGSAHSVAITVRKGAFNRIGMPFATFVK